MATTPAKLAAISVVAGLLCAGAASAQTYPAGLTCIYDETPAQERLQIGELFLTAEVEAAGQIAGRHIDVCNERYDYQANEDLVSRAAAYVLHASAIDQALDQVEAPDFTRDGFETVYGALSDVERSAIMSNEPEPSVAQGVVQKIQGAGVTNQRDILLIITALSVKHSLQQVVGGL